MFDIAQNFQNMVAGLAHGWLIGLGLTATITGLFVWLGGLGFKKILIALAAAVTAAGSAYIIAGPDIIPVAIAAAAATLIAIIFEKVFIAIIAGALAALFGFVIIANLYKVGLAQGLEHAFFQMPMSAKAIVAALVLVFILAGFYIRHFISALSCAALGTLLVFAGMISLLLYKGSVPVGTMQNWPSFYTIVFIVMVAFGTTAQLLLCPPPRKRTVSKKQATDDKENSEQTHAHWRTQ